MKAAILDIGEKYYTHMYKIFNSIENEQINYNWLITNCECYPQEKSLDEMFSKEYIWISGRELTEIINIEDFQFIWGVFSGFTPEIKLEDVLKHELPYADGYEGFWGNEVGIQHPLAEIEIVAWDSSLTMIISKNDKLVETFRKNFPLSKDLISENQKNKNVSNEKISSKYKILKFIFNKNMK